MNIDNLMAAATGNLSPPGNKGSNSTRNNDLKGNSANNTLKSNNTTGTTPPNNKSNKGTGKSNSTKSPRQQNQIPPTTTGFSPRSPKSLYGKTSNPNPTSTTTPQPTSQPTQQQPDQLKSPTTTSGGGGGGENRMEPLPDVDPELAGLVCRKVILPLFENNDMVGLGPGQQGSGSEDGSAMNTNLNPNLIAGGIPRDGIVAEIKLSDSLLTAVMSTRNELHELKRRYTNSVAECDILQKKLTDVKKKTQVARVKMDENQLEEQEALKKERVVENKCLLLKRQKRTLLEEREKVIRDNEELKIMLLEAEEKVLLEEVFFIWNEIWKAGFVF